MRVVVAGFGVQGRKRKFVAGADCVAVVDPVHPEADFRALQDVPPERYDAVLACIPDAPKHEVLDYCVASRKHVLVEKPLWVESEGDLVALNQKAQGNGVLVYTAYNHRFEPHYLAMRDLIASGELGEIYSCRMFYGNGTARLVRELAWRDQGAGVLPDLGSHLLDTCRFWFGDISANFAISAANCFENCSPDHVIIANEAGRPRIELEMTLLMWRNHFTCDILAERGTAHISSLCKWGPTTFTRRIRVLPSGRPLEESVTLVEDDPTWAAEYAHFKHLCASGAKTDLANDLWLHRVLSARARGVAVHEGRGVSGPIVGYAGMTHLGIVSASAIAAAGFETVCFDPDLQLIARLQEGLLPVLEPGLDELIAQNGKRQRFTANKDDLSRCAVVYVSPDVATDDVGQSDTTALQTLIDIVVSVLDSQACMVVLSQVEPGFTRALKAPPEARRYYQVETLVFGNAVERAMKPERYIVGCADPSRPLNPNFRAVLEAFGCPILPMRYESAELAKISINCCLVGSISVANTLAELCEAIGADWSEITPALKLDRRIGQFSYLAPGLGIAGGNLERDLATVCRLADRHKTDSGVVKAWIHNSKHRRDWVVRTARHVLLEQNPKSRLAIWGLAYKENTHSVKNSPSLAAIAQMPEAYLRVHDPVVSASQVDHRHIETCVEPLEALHGSEALLILTPWPQYRQIQPAQIAASLTGRIVIDPYKVLDREQALLAGLSYHTLGQSGTQSDSPGRMATTFQTK